MGFQLDFVGSCLEIGEQNREGEGGRDEAKGGQDTEGGD